MAKRLIFLLLILTLTLTITAQDETPEWNGEGRFTLLILGMDRRPNEGESLLVRTDVMIVASLDTETKSIGLLHIPRDLHFTPPGSGDFLRVNTLMLEGELVQPGYGLYYARDVVQYNLGMYIDRYLLFDFDAFIDIIDALGGLEITTTYTIYDPEYPDMNYGFDPFYLPAGTHRLSGYDALRYARTRHGDNDFVRGERQMQVLRALHAQIVRDGSVRDVLGQVPSLMRTLGNHVYTDLTLGEIVLLGLHAADVNNTSINTGSINTQYNLLYRDNTRNIFIPDRLKLSELLISVFGANYSEF